MSEKERLLVTSALPYANGPVHLGHLAGAYLPADIYVRYKRLTGADVLYICGTDEHGVTITIKAEKEKTDPQKIVDKYYNIIKDGFEKAGISFDNFSRTSLKIHHKTSQEFFQKLNEKGYLDKKEFTQLFCANDKMFLPDRYVGGTCPFCDYNNASGDECENCGKWLDPLQLIEPKCKICGSKPEPRQTHHWSIKLGEFQNELKEWMSSKKNWRENVKNFCNGWFEEGLKDRAVTRDLKWGVPVPFEGGENKVLYVWFEAPIGYISSTKEWAEKTGNPDKWKDFWMDSNTKMYHFIGKDNIVFHAILFPIMLKGYSGFNLPENVVANEFLNLEGGKFSTSRNHAVWLGDYLERFHPDPLRYYLTAIAPETKDSDFTWKDFQTRNNSELADILGNFINRTLSFVTRYFDNKVPDCSTLLPADNEILAARTKTFSDIAEALESFHFRNALYCLMDLCRASNRYFDHAEPWKSVKSDKERCGTSLYVCMQLVKAFSQMMQPFMPFKAKDLEEILYPEKNIPKKAWKEFGDDILPAGHVLGKSKILFKKIENKVIEREIERLKTPDKNSKTEKEKQKTELVDIDYFKGLKLKVAEILEAERVPKTKNLLKILLDDGEGKRQIISGIAKDYSTDELVGKKIAVITNLKPAKICGVESNGMLLAASDESSLTLLTVDKDIPNGSIIS